MSDRIPVLLEPIQNRLDAATPGPWTDALGKTFKAVGSIADARFIVNAPTDQARLLAAVKAVTALHYENIAYADDIAEGGDEVPEDYERHYCNEDGETWPCPTVSAVEAALRSEA